MIVGALAPENDTAAKGQGPDLVIVIGEGRVIAMLTDVVHGPGHMIVMRITDAHVRDHVIETTRGIRALSLDREPHGTPVAVLAQFVIGIQLHHSYSRPQGTVIFLSNSPTLSGAVNNYYCCVLILVFINFIMH